jgi:putative copper resistance protein D
MLDVALVLARIAQYVAAVVLFGSPLFCLYGLPRRGSAAAAGLAWPRPLFRIASVVLFAGAVVALGATTANMTGAAADALRPSAWLGVVTGADFGPMMAGRIALALAALAVASLGRPSPALWGATSLLGAGALASFAWTGHGASDEGLAGAVHLAGDVVHLLAAGVWLGALAALAILLLASRLASGRRTEPAAVEALHRGLAGFSGIGTATVAALVATGLMNSWFLVGPRHVGDLLATAWGLVLCAKLAVFVGMLALAGLNRFRLTPGLERSLAEPYAALRRLCLSVAAETGAGAVVLVLVGVLGTLAPPSGG